MADPPDLPIKSRPTGTPVAPSRKETGAPLRSDPVASVTGRSATVAEIGRELGELDFDPDDLLASLYPVAPEPKRAAVPEPAVAQPIDASLAEARKLAPEATLAASALGVPTFQQTEPDTLLKQPPEPARAAPQRRASEVQGGPFSVVPPQRKSIVPQLSESQLVNLVEDEPELPPLTNFVAAGAKPQSAEPAFDSKLDSPDVEASEELAVLEELVELPPERHSSLSFPQERHASSHLEQFGLTQTFAQLAELLVSEARARRHPQERAELEVVSSELFAMTGQKADALKLIAETPQSSIPLVATQHRQLAFDPDDLTAYAQLVRGELRSAATHESRRHLMTLYVDVARRLGLEEAEQRRHLELSLRAFPTDSRLQLQRLASSLTESQPSSPARARSAPSADALCPPEVLRELQQLRQRSVLSLESKHPVTLGLVLRRAIQSGKATEATIALTALRQLDDYRGAATWILTSLLRNQPASHGLCDTLLQALACDEDDDTKLALLEHGLAAPGAPPSSVEVFAQDIASRLTKEDQLGLALAARADKATLKLLASALGDPSTVDTKLLPLVLAVRYGLLEEPITEGIERASAADCALGRGLARIRPESPTEAGSSDVQGLSLDALLALSQRESTCNESLLSLGLRFWHATHGDSLTSTATTLGALAAELPDRERPAALVLAALLLERDDNRGQSLAVLNQCLSQFGSLEVIYRAIAAQSTDGSAGALLPQLIASLPPSLRRTMLELEQRFAEPVRGSSPVIEESAASPPVPLRDFLATLDHRLVPFATLLSQQADALSELRFVASEPDELEFAEALSRWQSITSDAFPTAIATTDPLAGFDALLSSAKSFGQLPLPKADDFGAIAEQWQSPVAAQLARLLVETSGGDRERFDSTLSLLEATEPRPSVESIESMAWLDPERDNAVGSKRIAQILAQLAPDYLGALRPLLLFATTEGSFSELGQIASHIAPQVDGPERGAHAWLASMASIDDAKRSPELGQSTVALSTLLGHDLPRQRWAVRRLLAEARDAGDDASLIDLLQELRSSATSALDGATLLLRAAEAAARLQRWDDEERLLEEAVGLFPEHLVALSMRAEFLEARGDSTKAAEAFDALAQASCMPAHKVAALLHAAELFEAGATPEAPSEAAIRCLQSALSLDPLRSEPQEQLHRIYVAQDRFDALEELLTQQLLAADSTEQRLALELERAKVLLRLGREAEAQIGLERAISLCPEHEEALLLSSQLLERAGEVDDAEQRLLKLAATTKNVEHSLYAYRRLAQLYDTVLEQPNRAEIAYREVLQQSPADPAGDQLVALLLRVNNAGGAVDVLVNLLDASKNHPLERDRNLELSRIYDEALGERRRAEEILEKARRRWPNDGAVLTALAAFYRRGKDPSAFTALLDRSLADARRALNAGRFELGFFDIIATVGELSDRSDLTQVARASLGALLARPIEVLGLGMDAVDPRSTSLLAPDVLSLPLRALLRRTGWVMSAAAPVDLRSLRAVPLADHYPELCRNLDSHAKTAGLNDVTWYLSPALGTGCQPLGSRPLTVVVGPNFCTLSEKRVQDALAIRALGILAANAPALANTAPVELWPLLVAYLSLYLPDWLPTGVDAQRVQALRAKMKQALPGEPDGDLPALAADVAGSIGNRASQLGLAVQQWGSRTALLALGDPNAVLVSIAAASGQLDRLSNVPEERLKWVVRNPEARDLMVFSVTDCYLEARSKHFS